MRGNPRDGATACNMRETRETALLHVTCGKPARRHYCMYPRDGTTACNMRETRETALLHAWVQSSAGSAHGMHIHIFNKVAVRKKIKYEKITDS